MPLIDQIVNLVNDSVADATGENARLTVLDTTQLVATGQKLSEQQLFENFYGALANRIVKTVYFVRNYKTKNRNILQDAHEYGAFIQKVYTEMPVAVENPSHSLVEIDPESGERSYQQHSPYDIENVINVTAQIYGGQGTWSIEFFYPEDALATAFTSWDKMARLVDYIWVTADNAMKLHVERLEADAVNTAMANSIAGSKARNLLAEYNTAHPDNELTVAEALEDLDFLKYATKEINRCVENMQYMGKAFNVEGYKTFTPRENLVVELLSEFAKDLEVNLQADTYHKDLVSLPKFTEIAFWQNPGTDGTFPFDKCSAINVKHSKINNGSAVSQTGIIAFLHDTENVACYFNRKRQYTKFNERDEAYINMYKAREGYAVDGHANAMVFYLADTTSNKATDKTPVEDDKPSTEDVAEQPAKEETKGKGLFGRNK